MIGYDVEMKVGLVSHSLGTKYGTSSGKEGGSISESASS